MSEEYISAIKDYNDLQKILTDLGFKRILEKVDVYEGTLYQAWWLSSGGIMYIKGNNGSMNLTMNGIEVRVAYKNDKKKDKADTNGTVKKGEEYE